MFFGKLGKHFAVKQHRIFFELVHERAVGDAVGARGGVDFDIPKCPHIPLFFAAVVECVAPRVKQRLFCGAFFGLALPTKPLRLAKDVSAAF